MVRARDVDVVVFDVVGQVVKHFETRRRKALANEVLWRFVPCTRVRQAVGGESAWGVSGNARSLGMSAALLRSGRKKKDRTVVMSTRNRPTCSWLMYFGRYRDSGGKVYLAIPAEDDEDEDEDEDGPYAPGLGLALIVPLSLHARSERNARGEENEENAFASRNGRLL